MKILAIETATYVCGIANIVDGISINIVEEIIPRQHAEKTAGFL